MATVEGSKVIGAGSGMTSVKDVEAHENIKKLWQKTDLLAKDVNELKTEGRLCDQRYDGLTDRVDRMEKAAHENHGQTLESLRNVLKELGELSDKLLIFETRSNSTQNTRSEIFSQWLPLTITLIYTAQLIYKELIQ